MPFTEGWPFKRVMVDHLLYGTTRIWWELAESFVDPTPRTFQLQAGYTGMNTALDWIDIGDSVEDTWYLEDDTSREPAGKLNLTHYRVSIDTSEGRYVSQPTSIWGMLEKADWLVAREIARKERLRLGLAGVDVYLLKRFRHGVTNTEATDFLTGAVVDSRHPKSWGTPFKVGYHPPMLLTIDSTTWSHAEKRGGDNPAAHSSLHVVQAPRMLAAPFVHAEDVLVDARTDQRWSVGEVKVLTAWRGVPLIVQPTLSLLPHNNVVYKIPVGAESYDVTDLYTEPLPAQGNGCVNINHDYPTNENLTYQTAECCGIAGATILAFTAEDWAGGARTAEHAVASSQTTANGHWAWDMKLDPGDYVLSFEKTGEYGPDTVELTVADPGPPPPLASLKSSSSSVSSSFGPI